MPMACKSWIRALLLSKRPRPLLVSLAILGQSVMFLSFNSSWVAVPSKSPVAANSWIAVARGSDC